MKSNSLLRMDARNALRGQWGINVFLTVIAAILSGLIMSAFNMVTKFPSDSIQQIILELVVTCGLTFAFTYGLYYVHLYVIRGGRAEFEQLFAIFDKKYYLPMLIINLIEQMITLLLGFLIFLPVLAVIGVGVYLSMVFSGGVPSPDRLQELSTGQGILMAILILALSLVFIFISLILSGLFQFAAWTKMDFPELPIGKTFSYAWKLLKNNLGRYILLQLSFIGWYFLGFIALIIGILWAAVYNQVSVAAFYAEAQKIYGTPEM